MKKLMDISQFFTRQPISGGVPCQKSAENALALKQDGAPRLNPSTRNAVKRPNAYIRERTYFLSQPLKSLICSTVTIGNQRYGELSFKDQAKAIQKAIRQHIKRNPNYKYFYVIEKNGSGVAHAHGLECGTYQKNFVDSFNQFGKHNRSDKSFDQVRDKVDYWNYLMKDTQKMAKDYGLYPISNVHRVDVQDINHDTEPRTLEIVQCTPSPWLDE